MPIKTSFIGVCLTLPDNSTVRFQAYEGTINLPDVDLIDVTREFSPRRREGGTLNLKIHGAVSYNTLSRHEQLRRELYALRAELHREANKMLRQSQSAERQDKPMTSALLAGESTGLRIAARALKRLVARNNKT